MNITLEPISYLLSCNKRTFANEVIKIEAVTFDFKRKWAIIFEVTNTDAYIKQEKILSKLDKQFSIRIRNEVLSEEYKKEFYFDSPEEALKFYDKLSSPYTIQQLNHSRDNSYIKCMEATYSREDEAINSGTIDSLENVQDIINSIDNNIF